VRIGIIHSFYRSEIPSGENLTVVDIAEILNGLGHDVSIWRFDSDLVFKSRKAQLRQMFKIIKWSSRDASFDEWLKNQEVIQIHNYFPGVTFSNLRSMKNSELVVNRVIHNYRKTCLQGNHFRNNKICQKCDQQKRISGVIRRCYNKQFLLSLFMSIYSRKIEEFEKSKKITFIAISSTVSNYLARIGVANSRIRVIPNSVPRFPVIPKTANECAFFGRIEAEKGIFQLLDAWKLDTSLPMLHVVGSGTRLNEVRNQAKSLKNVTIHGAKYGQELESVLQLCKVAIFPGLWDEPFGRTLVESLARGQAIACSTRFSHFNTVTESLNGSIFENKSSDIIESVRHCLELEYEGQVNESLKMWKEYYSPSAISMNWKDQYEN
jgi:glycosyltransferase involved in cell wall biosynthesis